MIFSLTGGLLLVGAVATVIVCRVRRQQALAVTAAANMTLVRTRSFDDRAADDRSPRRGGSQRRLTRTVSVVNPLGEGVELTALGSEQVAVEMDDPGKPY